VIQKWCGHIFGMTEILKDSHKDEDETKIPMTKTLFSQITIIKH
jgi:hypothetical protein